MLDKDFYIIDDAVSLFRQDYFEASIFGKIKNDSIRPTVEFTTKYELTAQEKDGTIPMSFEHILKSSPRLSPHLENFSQIAVSVCEKMDIFLKDIYFARIFLTLPYKTELDHAAPHTDMGIPHWVILYYVNDADGDTVFFDKNDKIIYRVTPKKGRAILFNGNIKHGGGIPKQYSRCIVNFDIMI